MTQVIVEQAGGGGQAARQASYGRGWASNFMGMNNVVQNLSQQIEYLSALAEMYSRGGDKDLHAAALEAKATLERLVCAINGSPRQPCPELPLAA